MSKKTVERELQALLRIGTALTSTKTRHGILYLLVQEIAKVVDVKRCSIILVNVSRPVATVVASHEDPSLGEISIDLKRYPEIEESMRTGKIVLVHDVKTDPRMAPVLANLKHLNIHSILVIPMVYQEQILGTLFLRTSRTRRAFTKAQLLFCQVAARIAANTLLGISRYQLVVREKNQLAEAAGRDFLTRMYNQGTLYRRLAEELAVAQRYHRTLSYLMIDIDNFKEVNDNFGHRQGDQLLRQVARTIQKTTRKVDIVARYGGDEFGIILPETDAKGSYIQAERIRKAIHQARFPMQDHIIKTTVSIGIATFPHKAVQTAEALIRQADEALYLAKSQGKDRTIRSSVRHLKARHL